MRRKTVAALLEGGQLLMLLRFKGLFKRFYRLCFLASVADSGLMQKLAHGPVAVESLTRDCGKKSSSPDAVHAWIRLGVRLGVIREKPTGYSLRGWLMKKLAAPQNDAVRALIREAAELHYLYIMQTPVKLEQGVLWKPEEGHHAYGDVIARSSQALAPFLCEVIDRFFPASDNMRLLEVGCGHGRYILHAAERHRNLQAIGLELDAHVAQAASNSILASGLQHRITVEIQDVRQYQSEEGFDVLTLYNNIYYFPVEERIELLTHLRRLLNPNGRILITTGCINGGIEFELVNLIHATTNGWGRLPLKDELLQQLSAAGFERSTATNLIPGDQYYVFAGYNPG